MNKDWREKFDEYFDEFFDKYDSDEWCAKGQIKSFITTTIEDERRKLLSQIAALKKEPHKCDYSDWDEACGRDTFNADLQEILDALTPPTE